MPTDVSGLTLKEAQTLARKGNSQSIRQACLERVRRLNPKINAFLRPQALEQDAAREPGRSDGILSGLPVSIKDNICIRGREVSCASRILRGHVPPYDATVIERLKHAGAAIFGQCNMDEFAFGSSTESSAAGPCRNPWDLERVPGGSSGGSAAAVAADMTLAALGTDTGGSIREPASFCGVVGLKPTYGRVSRYGLVAFGSSFDQIGPITKTVEDAAILMNVLAGHDERDSTSAPNPVPDYTASLRRDVKDLKIGLPEEYFSDGLDPEVGRSVRSAAETFKKMGARVQTIRLPHMPYAIAVYYIVAVAEASSNLGRYDGVQYGLRAPERVLRDMYLETRDQGFGEEAKRRILLGTFVLSAGYYEAYYLKGQKVRTLIRKDYEAAFREVDLILGPTAPTPAFKLGEKIEDPLSMYLSDIFTIPANLVGIPAMSIPCGFTASNLPIGMQLMARPFEEETLFRAAYAFEQEMGIHTRKPKL